MSKLTDIFTTSFTLSTAAAEEASRYGVHIVDVEHILLALAISDSPAGEILREQGLTLDDARHAVTAHHREQLGSLGIDADLPGDGEIRFHQRGGYDYTDRAMRVISEAGGWQRAGETLPILRDLVIEPSGTIAAILFRLGTDPETIVERIEDAERTRGSAKRTSGAIPRDAGRRLSRTQSVFVPASPADVWALVSDPERLPEWELNLESVTATDDAWTGRTRTLAPDGRNLKVKPGMRRQTIEQVSAEGSHVVWRLRFPDSPRANSRRIEVGIDPAPGGSTVTVRFAWERGTRVRGIRRLAASAARLLMRPVVAIVFWVQVSALASGISRALR